VERPYPTWAIVLSMILATASMFPILGYATVQIIKGFKKSKSSPEEEQEVPLKET